MSILELRGFSEWPINIVWGAGDMVSSFLLPSMSEGVRIEEEAAGAIEVSGRGGSIVCI